MAGEIGCRESGYHRFPRNFSILLRAVCGPLKSGCRREIKKRTLRKPTYIKGVKVDALRDVKISLLGQDNSIKLHLQYYQNFAQYFVGDAAHLITNITTSDKKGKVTKYFSELELFEGINCENGFIGRLFNGKLAQSLLLAYDVNPSFRKAVKDPKNITMFNRIIKSA